MARRGRLAPPTLPCSWPAATSEKWWDDVWPLAANMSKCRLLPQRLHYVICEAVIVTGCQTGR